MAEKTPCCSLLMQPLPAASVLAPRALPPRLSPTLTPSFCCALPPPLLPLP